MTGIEAAATGVSTAVGKGILKAAVADAAEQRAVNKALLEAVKTTPEFDRAVHMYGERIALRQGVATGLFRFFAKWLPIQREYFKVGVGLDPEALTEDLAQKMLTIPEEDLQSPRRAIAGPAFEALGYAVDEPILRDLYLELLARAADRRFAEAAHPSFVEVIRQLSSDEAGLLRSYLSNSSGLTEFPIVALNSVIAPGFGIERLYNHLLNIIDPVAGTPHRNPSIPTYVDNWVRLGLVEVTYLSYIAEPSAYDWVVGRPETAEARVAVTQRQAPQAVAGQAEETYQLDIVKGCLTPTDYGNSFALAVGMLGDLERNV